MWLSFFIIFIICICHPCCGFIPLFTSPPLTFCHSYVVSVSFLFVTRLSFSSIHVKLSLIHVHTTSNLVIIRLLFLVTLIIRRFLLLIRQQFTFHYSGNTFYLSYSLYVLFVLFGDGLAVCILYCQIPSEYVNCYLFVIMLIASFTCSSSRYSYVTSLQSIYSAIGILALYFVQYLKHLFVASQRVTYSTRYSGIFYLLFFFYFFLLFRLSAIILCNYSSIYIVLLSRSVSKVLTASQHLSVLNLQFLFIIYVDACVYATLALSTNPHVCLSNCNTSQPQTQRSLFVNY